MPTMTKWQLPKGSILPNWPLLLGVVVSVIGIVGLMMTAESDENEGVDVLEQRAEGREVETAPVPDDVRALTAAIDSDARRRQSEVAAQRRREEQESQRRSRQAQIDTQRAADALRRARRQAEAMRALPSQPSIEDAGSEALALSSDETTLIQALRLEDRQRQAEALRAPAVVSSARGIGERSHVLQPRGSRPGPPSPRAPSGRQPSAGPSLSGPPFSGSVPPPLPGARRPGQPGRPSAGAGAQGAFPPVFEPDLSTPVDDAIAVPGGVPDWQAALRGQGAGAFTSPQAGMGTSGAPGGAPASSDAVAGPGAPPALRNVVAAGTEASGAFNLGPRADGGLGSSPVGVVVAPDDGPHHRLYEGTILPAVLQTQLNGQYSGPLSAQITRSVWSRDRRHVLVPRGTIALGTVGSVQATFQDRLAITFHRLIFPDGRWLELGFVGLNGIGETSLKDLVDRHYLQLFGTAGAIGLLAGFTQSSGEGSGGFRSGVSEQMANTSLQIVSQYLNRRPDITIRAGHRVNVRLTSDVVIPDGAL